MNEIGKHVIKRVRKGNIKAFQKLVEHYQQSVYNICVLMMGNEKEAEELARETFVYAYSHIEDYFKSGKKFSIWLYQAIVSLAQQSLKEDFEVCDAQSAKAFSPCC